LSLKHTYLAHDVQKIEGTPYRSYLEIEEARCSRAHSTHPLPSLAAAPFVLQLYVTRATGSQRAAGAPREQVDPQLRCKFTYIPCGCAVSCRGLIATSIPITADRHALFIAAPGLPTAPCLAHREAEHPRLLRRGRAQSCAQASAATKRSPNKKPPEKRIPNADAAVTVQVCHACRQRLQAQNSCHACDAATARSRAHAHRAARW
jgi:hypothetical protein